MHVTDSTRRAALPFITGRAGGNPDPRADRPPEPEEHHQVRQERRQGNEHASDDGVVKGVLIPGARPARL